MPRADKDVDSRVNVTIMNRTALRATPMPYSKVCDTFRPRHACAGRTDLGGQVFTHFLERSPVRNRFIAEHVSESGPASVVDAFGHAGFGQSRGIHIAYRDEIESFNQLAGLLVQEVPAGVSDPVMNVPCLPLLTSPLRFAKLSCEDAEVTRVVDGLSGGQGGEGLQSQVDTDSAASLPARRFSHLNNNIQEPVAASVLAETAAIANSSLQLPSAIKYANLHTLKNNGVPLLAQSLRAERNPSQRVATPIAKAVLAAHIPGLHILTTDAAFSIGHLVRISGILGTTELNFDSTQNNNYSVISSNSTTVTINVDSSGFTPYISGGSVVQVSPLNQFAEIELHGFILDVSPSMVLA